MGCGSVIVVPEGDLKSNGGESKSSMDSPFDLLRTDPSVYSGQAIGVGNDNFKPWVILGAEYSV